MLLSVCIVTYNHEKYIEECIVSALNQITNFNYEVVVADDNSTDQTATILKQLEKKYPEKLRVIYREKNMGAGDNFAATLADCKGEYIAFLEGDNFWSSTEKLQKQIDMLIANLTLSASFHKVRSYDATNKTEEFLLPSSDPPQEVTFEYLVQDDNPIAFGSMVVKSKYLEEINKWTQGLKVGDWPICMMLAQFGPIGYIPEEMSRQRMHDGGSWTSLSPILRTFYIIEMLYYVDNLLSEDHAQIIKLKLAKIITWWSNEIFFADANELKILSEELKRIANPDFSNFILLELIKHTQLNMHNNLKNNPKQSKLSMKVGKTIHRLKNEGILSFLSHLVSKIRK